MASSFFSDLDEPQVETKKSKSDYFSDLSEESSGLKKTARIGAQYGIGLVERAALPYNVAVSPLSSKGAQAAEFRKNIFEDIERLQEQKQAGDWSPQDEELLQTLISQIKHPEEAEKFVKTADISSSGLIEKGAKQLGYDLTPEGIEEEGARIVGNILSPKSIVKGTKSLIKTAPKLATKEGRAELKAASQWKSLAKSAKGDTAKEEILDFAKIKNLTPEEATLLLQSNAKIKTLEKISKKTKRFKNIVSGLNKKLGGSYKELKDIGRRGGYLSEKEASSIQNDLSTIVQDIEKTYVEGPDTKAAKGLIEETIHKLDNKAGTVEDLINSRRNLRQSANWKNLDEGDVIRAKAEKAFFDAIERKNPQVAKELARTDKAWAKYKQFERMMEKQPHMQRWHGVPVTGVMAHLVFGAAGLMAGGIPGVAKVLITKELAQRISTRLLTDPKFQSIRKKMLQSVISGSQKNQKGLLTAFMKILEKEDPELYDELDQSIKNLKISSQL